MKNWKLDRPGINVSTLYRIKGLEADVVILPDIDKHYSKTKDRKLCYVAMTRATKYLVISATGKNNWTDDIEEILSENQKNNISGDNGYCIVCMKSIPFDRSLIKIRCRNCWSKNRTSVIEGNYCHHCSEKNRVTTEKPVCYSCYKKITKLGDKKE